MQTILSQQTFYSEHQFQSNPLESVILDTRVKIYPCNPRSSGLENGWIDDISEFII